MSEGPQINAIHERQLESDWTAASAGEDGAAALLRVPSPACDAGVYCGGMNTCHIGSSTMASGLKTGAFRPVIGQSPLGSVSNKYRIRTVVQTAAGSSGTRKRNSPPVASNNCSS